MRREFLWNCLYCTVQIHGRKRLGAEAEVKQKYRNQQQNCTAQYSVYMHWMTLLERTESNVKTRESAAQREFRAGAPRELLTETRRHAMPSESETSRRTRAPRATARVRATAHSYARKWMWRDARRRWARGPRHNAVLWVYSENADFTLTVTQSNVLYSTVQYMCITREGAETFRDVEWGARSARREQRRRQRSTPPRVQLMRVCVCDARCTVE